MPYHAIESYTGPQDTIGNHTGLYRTTWSHRRPNSSYGTICFYGTIKDHRGQSGTIGNYRGPDRTIWGHKAPYLSILHHIGLYGCIIGRTEKTKISKLTKFRVKFHVSIHRYGVHGLKKVIFVHFGLRSGFWR